MNFWLRNIILAVILTGLAAALLMNQESLFSTDQEAAEDIAASTADIHHEGKNTPLATEITRDVLRPKESKNAAAEGLSRFYANLHGDIVYLPEPKGDLEGILEARRLTTRPLRKNWTGKTENHPFRLGETLFQKLSEYADDNGLEVIWWLDRDFLVKDAFRINKNIITTSYQVGKAIAGHFENGLSVYFCYQQRTIVLIEHDIPYLANECMLLPKARR